MKFEVWDVKDAFLKSPLTVSGVYMKLEAKVVTRMLNILKKKNPGK